MEFEQYLEPRYFHRELAKQKKLANEKGELLDTYGIISKFYQQLLEKYLGELLEINVYDETIEKTGLKFEEVLEEDKDIYQKGSNYKYFYLRNTVYIEKLLVEELNFLINKYNSHDYSLDEKTKELLGRTFKEVITSDIKEDNVLINYGPLDSTYFAPNNAVVFGIRCSDDFECADEDDEWLEINFQQQNYLERLKNELNEKCKDKLSIPVCFIIYDDENVLKFEEDFGRNA